MQTTDRPPSLPPEMLQEHLRDLGIANDVDISWYTGSPLNAGSNPDIRDVLIPNVRNDVDYYVGLHELGHVLAPGADYPSRPNPVPRFIRNMTALRHGRVPRAVPDFDATKVVDSEARAWRWACDHAMINRMDAVEEAIRGSLNSYLDAYPEPPAGSALYDVMTPEEITTMREARREIYLYEQRLLLELADLFGEDWAAALTGMLDQD